MPEVSIVIPAHNEEQRIGSTLSSYCQQFGGRNEIIVVLNGCSDHTLDVVRSVSQRHPGVVSIVDIKTAIGKGGAVHEGFRRASGSYIGFVDADGSTPPEEFQRLTGMVTSHDGVIGSRWMAGAQVFNRTSMVRKFMSRAFVVLTRLLFNLPYHDTQCGAKVFKRKVITTVLPYLKVRDMVFDVELLLLTRYFGFRIREVPTVWTDQSSSVFLGSITAIVRTSTIMLRSLLGLYLRVTRRSLL